MNISRKILIAGAGLLVAGGLFVVWQPSQSIRGSMAGEPFCGGYPSGYWGSQLLQEPGARSMAITQLQKSEADSVSVLRELLRDHANPEVRLTAAELLGKLGPVAQAAGEDLIQATLDGDSHVRNLAVITIPKVETPAAKALPALIPLLKTDHAPDAARAISVYKGQAKPALPELVKLLEDESRDALTRWNAARALGKLGPEGIDALPVLIRFTTSPVETIREHSAEAIGDIGPTAVEGIPALLDCLDDPAIRVRRDAVRSLGYIGIGAKSAVPQLKLLLNDPEEMVRKVTRDALKIIAPEELPAETPKSVTPASGEDQKADEKGAVPAAEEKTKT